MKNAAKSFGFTLVANVHTIAAFEAAEGDERRGRGLRSAPSLIPDGVLSGSQLEKFAMISKFTTHQKAEIWVNLDQIIGLVVIAPAACQSLLIARLHDYSRKPAGESWSCGLCGVPAHRRQRMDDAR